MIREKTVVICDVCGLTVEAKAVSAGYNDTIYVAPGGWRKGMTGTADICPACAKRLALHGKAAQSMSAKEE